MIKVGQGIDAHRFSSGRKLVLGGVEIPFEKGLDGHSDADVLLHAVSDALLGAAGMGDIGEHFPDTDPEYRGVSSLLLLKKVGEKIEASGWSIQNIDVTVVAERPKIKPHKDGMRENISIALGIRQTEINIKATTTEKMGFAGREEGILASAIALIAVSEKNKE